MNYYSFPIGDYSGDGHACVAHFIVKGNKPLIDVQNTYLKHPWISLLASQYGDDFVYKNIVNNLPYPDAGHVFFDMLIEKYDLEVVIDDWTDGGEEDQTEITMTYDSLIELWIFILNQINPELQLEIISPALVDPYKKQNKYLPKEETIEGSFQNYIGKLGSIDTPGYGVWIDYEGEFYMNCN